MQPTLMFLGYVTVPVALVVMETSAAASDNLNAQRQLKHLPFGSL